LTNAYRYGISLRIRHPAIDPARITRTLVLEPSRSWRAGEPRTTPVGTPLKGIWPESYWTTGNLLRGEHPNGEDLPDAIGTLLDRLAPHRDFFHEIRGSSGTAEFFIGWFFLGNSGDVFDWHLMARLVDLKIDLSFDVYPPDQPQNDI
jgi:hypothetical protein